MESMFLNIFSINNNKVTPLKSTQPQEQFEVRRRESDKKCEEKPPLGQIDPNCLISHFERLCELSYNRKSSCA